MARMNPGLKGILIQGRIAGQFSVDGIDDIVQEKGFIGGITLRAGKYDPIRAAGRQNGRIQIRETAEELPACMHSAGFAAVGYALIHALVVQLQDQRVHAGVHFRQENAFAVIIQRQV